MLKPRGRTKRDEKGLVIIYTGSGKGKTSAALGNVFRALGHGLRVLLVQFMKGRRSASCGETESARCHKNLEIIRSEGGFCGIMGDRKPLKEHREAAQTTFNLAKAKILTGDYDLVVLDEINCALSARLLAARDVEKLLKKKPVKTHVILTGRSAGKNFLRLADLVTEMKEVKHPFQRGLGAQKGIDY